MGLAPDIHALRPWLLTVARRAIDAARARRARPQEVGTVDMTVLPERDDPIERFCVAEEVRAALRRLPSGRRSVVVESYYGGRSVSEIASLLQIPEGTVKSRMHNALRALRGMLNVDARAGVGAHPE